MSDESDLEKTEAPSARRLAKAREEGQVARSRELTTFLALLAGGAGFSALGSGWIAHTTGTLKASLVLTRRDAFEPSAIGEHLGRFAGDALLAAAPLLTLITGAVIASTIVMGGFIFTSKPFTLDLSRLSPAKGLKRTWSVDGLTELGKAVLKSGLIGSIGAWLLWKDRDAFAAFGAQSLVDSLTMLGGMMVKDFLILASGLALVAAVDAPVQLWRHHKSLRMTKQEVRDEMRESEGDPAQKGRIRNLQRQAAKRRMMANVPKADVVVVNPTHYSVAIQYNAGMRAPKVVAKGSQLTALRIREIAAEYKVPVLEAPPLARALYKHTDLDREIPIALYEAVALVMAYVFQLKRWATHGGQYPNKPAALPVPKDLDFTPTAFEADAEDADE